MSGEEVAKRTLDLSELLSLFERWAPLILWFEQRKHGYGEYVVAMHGKRPMKVRKAGAWDHLKRVPLDIYVDQATLSALIHPASNGRTSVSQEEEK